MNKIATLGKIVSSATLLLALIAAMPVDFLTELENRYNEYRKKYPYVTLSLAFNQPSYIPGDTVFFSAAYLYEDHQYVKGTHLIRLDILAHDGSTKQTVRFKSTDGIGHNQLVIRTDLEPGIYTFVAYTDWLRNFGSTAFFQRDVVISNKNQFVKIPVHKGLVEFYPEGGRLVGGLDNRIVAIGAPHQKIVIKDESNTDLSTLTLNAVGTGSFTLKPVLNKKYVGFSPDENVTSMLPVVQAEGVAIKFESEDGASLQLSVSDQSKYRKENLFAIILWQGKMLISQAIEFDAQGLARIEFPARFKGSGFYQLFILDSDGKEVAQRVFTPMIPNDIKIKFRVADQVKQRSMFTFAVGVFDESDRLIESDLSLAVVQSNLFKIPASKELPLHGLPAVQSWANKYSNDYLPFLNDFLVSITWNRIDWESVYNKKSQNFNFPFRSQNTFHGRVVSRENNKPAPDSTQVIAYLQKNTMGYEAYTKDGNFEIPLIFDFWDDDLVFYTLRNRGKCVDEQYSIQMIKDTIDLKTHWISKELPEEVPYAAYALKRNLINRSYNFFSGSREDNLMGKSPNEVFEEEFQEVDYTINVADYVIFPTMEDMLQEIVTFVQFKKKGSDPSIRLYYRYEKSVYFYKHDPVYIIDGVMSTSTEYFLSLKPEDLLTLKVINNPNKLAQLGHLGENGFIFIESKKGNLAPRVESKLFPVTGLSRSVWNRKSEVLTSNTGTRIPDLRSTLYWNPWMKSDLRGFNEITLLTSDDAGEMKIIVQGITRDGRTFSAEHTFIVELSSDRP